MSDHSDKQYPILHVGHSDSVMRTQKRKSIRVEVGGAAFLYPLHRLEEANEHPENAAGLRCNLKDISEDGAALLVGGRGKAGMPAKLQFKLGDADIILSGVVRGVNFSEKNNRSILHLQAAPPSAVMRNRILAYVYDIFEERNSECARAKSAV